MPASLLHRGIPPFPKEGCGCLTQKPPSALALSGVGWGLPAQGFAVSHPPCSKQGEGMVRDQLSPAIETAFRSRGVGASPASPQGSSVVVCRMSPPRHTAGAARQCAEALPASFITQGELKWAGSWPSAWENLSRD